MHSSGDKPEIGEIVDSLMKQLEKSLLCNSEGPLVAALSNIE